jgi:dTDP-4-amino-4,6-dideoxygalactose transaminase
LWQKWSNTKAITKNTLLVIEDAAQSHGFEDEDQNVVKRDAVYSFTLEKFRSIR